MNHSLVGSHFTDRSFSLLVEVTLQATLVMIIAVTVSAWLRRRAAAVRHAVWMAALTSVVLLPVLNGILPRWRLLPAWAAAARAEPTRNDLIFADTDADADEDNATGRPPHSNGARHLERNGQSGVGARLSQVVASDHPLEALPDAHREIPAAAEHDPAVSGSKLLHQVPPSLPSLLLTVWLIGFSLFVLRLGASALYLCRIGRRVARSLDGRVCEQLETAKDELGWSGAIRLLIGRSGSMPMAWGVIWPSIMVPEESRDWSPVKLRAVLLHELAHIVRRDAMWQCLVEVARAIYWFHPLIWWAARCAHAERESACDDLVLERGLAPGDYAHQLLDVVSHGRLARIGLTAGIAMASTTRLERRLRSIMDKSTDRRPLRRSAYLTLVIASLIFVVPLAMIRIGEAADGKKPAGAKEGGATADGRVSPPGATIRNETDAAIQKRIRELIYILRYHSAFENVNEWASAIRELVQIGKPAVPELVAELDRTQRNETLRGLAFTLRAIGDPRAIPALIRSLAKKELRDGSDCLVQLFDAGLLAFMQKHENYHEGQEHYFAYGRPINEIATALVKLAHRDELADFRGPDLQGNWTQWWAAHRDEFATENELQSVQLAPRERDLVEEAGIARFGPLFFTGIDVVLGPVHEVELQFDGYLNAPAFIDFDTGRLYQEREGIADAAKSTPYVRVHHDWYREKGIDARCNASVMGIDLHLWLIDNSRWDTLQHEIDLGGPLDVGRRATSFMVPFGLRKTDFRNEELGTFLFITREGGRGVIQASPSAADGSLAHKIRYRMWGEKGRVGPAATAKKARRNEADWGPEHIAILKEPGRGRAFLFDLETGEKITPPDSLVATDPPLGDAFSSHKELAAWCRAHGANLGVVKTRLSKTFDAKPFGPTIGFDLVGLDMTALRVLPNSYDEMTVTELKELLARWPGRESQAYMLSLTDPRRDTYAIATKSGAMGLLQIKPTGDDQNSIVFRYRLAKDASRK
jgi:beta-lactamase regulating signal transducer with metallopeptidase domain